MGTDSAKQQTQATDERTRRQLLTYAESVPPLPDIVVRVLALLNDPISDAEALEKVVCHDPVLVGKILSLVNSALFSLNRKFESIGDSIVMIGRSPLKSLVLAYGAGPFMLADFSCYGHSERGMWQHSVAVAAATRSLAQSAGLDREAQEMLFVAGLLHDIGEMLIAPQLNDRGLAIAHFPGDATQMEKQATGIDHTEAGALVMAKWAMPDTIQEVVKQHHGGNGPADYRCHVACLRLAEAFCHEAGIGYIEGQTPEANYRAEDLQALNDSGSGSGWDQARTDMAAAIQDALDSLGSIIG